jgi:hypothetical protein
VASLNTIAYEVFQFPDKVAGLYTQQNSLGQKSRSFQKESNLKNKYQIGITQHIYSDFFTPLYLNPLKANAKPFPIRLGVQRFSIAI